MSGAMSGLDFGALSAALHQRCELVIERLSEPSVMRGWAVESARARAQLEGLSAALGRAQRPLTILLLGGTGVGKSTLLNALAGRALSEASDGRRAFTSSLQVYHHREDSIEHLSGLSRMTSLPHSAPELRHKVIIDAPDIDSVERDHHELVWSALPEVDLILYVTSWQKYRNRVITQRLSRLIGAHSLLCVLNQSDELGASDLAEVLEDLARSLREIGAVGAQQLAVSALSAREAQRGEPVSEERLAGFKALKRLLSEELTHSEVRQLTQLSATRVALRAVALLPQRCEWREGGLEATHEALSSAIEALRLGWEELKRELSSSLDAQLKLKARALRAAWRLKRTQGVRGPYGLYLSCARWLSHYGYGPAAQGGREALEATQRLWITQLERGSAQLKARLSELADQGCWSSDALDTLALNAEEERLLTGALSALSEERSKGGSGLELSELSLNLIPGLMSLAALAWLLDRLWSGPEPGLVSLLLALGLIYGSCAAQDRVLDELACALERRGELKAPLEQLIKQLSPLLSAEALEAELQRSAETLSALRESRDELARLHNQLHEQVRGAASARSRLLNSIYESAPQG